MRFPKFLFLLITLFSHQILSQVVNTNELAIVGEHKIYVDDFKSRYSDFLFSTGVKDNPSARYAVLEGMVNEILLINYDDNSKVLDNNAYQREINWISKQSPLTYLKDQEIFAKITVTDEELRTAFIRTNETLTASHLYAQNLEEAEYLYNLVKMGVDWDNLAAQIFTDSILSNNGGFIGEFTYGEMDPAFEEAAYNLKVGEISKPVKTKTGYSIIRLESKVTNPLLTESEFQSKKNKLIQALKIKRKIEEEKKYIESVFNESKYTINDASVNNISEFLNLSDLEKKESQNKISNNIVAVKYDTLRFSEKYVVDQLNFIPDYHRTRITSSELLKTVIKGITMQQVLYAEVLKKGYDKVPLVVESTNNMKKQVFLKYKIDDVLSNSEITDSSLEPFYNKNKSSFKNPNEISIQEILLESKIKADSIYQLLLKGENFGLLAQTHSIREASAKNEGVIDYSDINMFGSVRKQLWDTNVGDLIGPLEVYGYYGIFKVLGKKEGTFKPFTNVKESVLSLYKFQNKKNIVGEYLKKVKQKVVISINNQVLSSINFLEKQIN